MIEEALKEIANIVGKENLLIDNANLRIFQYGAWINAKQCQVQ